MTLAGTYRPRHPETSAFYQCLQDYWAEFQESYPYFYEKDHGPLRPVVERTWNVFSQCGIFRHGFAPIRCSDCHHEFLLAFSCKTRYFCPACQAVQWVTEEILEPVEHRQYVWTIPKVLRGAFRRDRSLLGELSRARKSLRDYDPAVLGQECTPGAIGAIQTYGDELNWHPHLHSLVSDAAWDRQGNPHPLPRMDSETLARLFPEHVLRMLVSKRRLTREFAQRLRSWRHPGFQDDSRPSRPPGGRGSSGTLERLYLAAQFRGHSLALRCAAGPSPLPDRQGFDPFHGRLRDWIARVTSHIPNPHEQMVRY